MIHIALIQLYHWGISILCCMLCTGMRLEYKCTLNFFLASEMKEYVQCDGKVNATKIITHLSITNA